MHISEISVRRPITTFMFYLAVFMIGAVSLSKLAVDLLPDLSFPKLTIWTQYSNVAPEEIERLITKPIESALQTIKDKNKITSVSQEGISLVKVDFDWGSDMNLAMLLVREKLNDVKDQFPDGASSPVIIQIDPSSQPIMSLSVSGEDLVALKEISTAIFKRRLEQLDGVALATVTGGVDREIQVNINVNKLNTLGLSLEQVSSAINSANRSQAGGFIRKGRFRYSIRTLGEFTDVEQIENVVVSNYGSGNIVYLRDIAQVRDSFRDPDNKTRYNTQESIGLIIQKEAGANTVNVATGVKEILVDLRKEYPDYQFAIAYNQADFIEASIYSVLQSIFLGGILAFLVLFLFLHDPRNPINISISIPVSIVATFGLLYFSDISLNIMSLGGLAMGIGMLVDNSIVVLENIFRHRQEGKSIIDATILGAQEVGLAVTASTFTTISVFFPIIFVEGVAGQLFKSQSLTVTFSLICSLIVSLTLLPMLASRFLHFEKKEAEEIIPIKQKEKVAEVKKEEIEAKEKSTFAKIIGMIILPFKFVFVTVLYKYVFFYGIWKGVFYYFLYIGIMKYIFGTILFTMLGILKYWMEIITKVLNYIFIPLFKKFDIYFDIFTDFYEGVLEKSLKNREFTLFITALIFSISLFLGLDVDRELMPQADQRQFEIEVSMPIGSPLDITDNVVLEISNLLVEVPDVAGVFTSAGIVQEKGIQSERTGSLNRGLILVKLKEDGELSTEEVLQIVRENQELYADAELNFSTGETSLQQVLGTEESDITVNITGEEFETTSGLMLQLRTKLDGIRGLADIHSSFEEGKPEIRIEVDRERTNRYGISVREVADFIESSMKGNVATEFKDFDKKIDILVRPDMKFRDELDDLLNNFYTRNDLFIPIRELIKYSYTRGPNEIIRENQVRTIQLYANIHDRPYKDVIGDIQEAINEIPLPDNDYGIKISGENDEMQKSFQSLFFALLISIALVYMILAAQFESLKQPFVIMFAVPLSFIGVFFSLYYTGHSFNIMSAIGIIILVGIVVNDAIVKVDFINQSREKGLSLHKAIVVAGKKRLRPIIMTTVTTVFGLMPMAIGLGHGTEMQAPMAVTVIGGLISATFLTLIVIPIMYSYVEQE